MVRLPILPQKFLQELFIGFPRLFAKFLFSGFFSSGNTFVLPRKDSSASYNSNHLLSLPSGCPVFSGNYSGVSFASPRTVFSGTILPRTIFFSIVVVVPVYLACVLYPASKITIIIINKCPVCWARVKVVYWLCPVLQPIPML